MRVALTIAGSDSGGGAGIQADLKTFHAFGVFGASALSLVTAQNTLGVQGVHLLPAALLRQQVDSVVEDLQPRAVKTGALGCVELIEEVAGRAEHHRLAPLVVDPVMVSKHGDPLLGEEAVRALVERLFPLATLVTPNLHEASALVGRRIGSISEMEQAAESIGAMGSRAVLIKGGAGEGRDAVDVLWDGESVHRFSAPRIATQNTHGTGCTFSAAITACLALGDPLLSAVENAKRYITEAIAQGPRIGGGVGPVNHWVQARG